MATPQSQDTLAKDQAKPLQMGDLWKRQRGLHHIKSKRKFQKRFFQLYQDVLEYYKTSDDRDSKALLRGRFLVHQIKVVERVPTRTFGRDFCFQVGDDNEVLYLVAENLDEMNKWMEELRKAAKLSDNRMMEKYHTGVYDHRRRAWSCCEMKKEKSDGCCSVERCQSENHGQPFGRDNHTQEERSTSEVLPQPQFMDHPTKVPLSPTKNIPQLPKQQLDPPALPPRRPSKLSDTRIPSSKIKLSETLEEGRHGQFGVVYKACLLREGPPSQEITVALKTPKDPKASHELWEEGLTILIDLHHDHVIQVIGICTEGPIPGIIMPFMENGSLLSYVQKKGDLVVPTDTQKDDAKVTRISTKLIGMCSQIAEGMKYLASKNLIHRDLAARNCMMDSALVIKVADFGLINEVYFGKNYYQHNQKAAQLPQRWMAPESRSSEGDHDFSEKSDVWSFGITCWEVFSGGETPYLTTSSPSHLSSLKEGQTLEKPQNAACSDEMFDIMKKCWKLKPEDRPTFSELKALLEQREDYLTGYITLSQSDNQAGRDNHTQRKRSRSEDFLSQPQFKEHPTPQYYLPPTQQVDVERPGNQAEASTQQKEKSVKAKAATEVFRKNFPKLLETVEPPKLAAVLFAEKIISDAVLKEFCNSTSNNQGGQTLKLLHDVLSVIETDPEYFGQVCTALEKDYASNAEKLRDEFKSYLEELTKDKANGETSKSVQAEN